MQRLPEPELMNDADQALAYALADFSVPHEQFVEQFSANFPHYRVIGPVLDLGCGPADVSRRFALAYPECRIHGIDGAPHMLELGRVANQQAGLAERIELFEINLPAASLPEQAYRTIISNSLLHHLHDPQVLWRSIRQYAAPGAIAFVMDLFRPSSEAMARELVDTYASTEPAILRADFYASLRAAFTPKEIRQQLDAAQLAGMVIETCSDRHVIIYGTIA